MPASGRGDCRLRRTLSAVSAPPPALSGLQASTRAGTQGRWHTGVYCASTLGAACASTSFLVRCAPRCAFSSNSSPCHSPASSPRASIMYVCAREPVTLDAAARFMYGPAYGLALKGHYRHYWNNYLVTTQYLTRSRSAHPRRGHNARNVRAIACACLGSGQFGLTTEKPPGRAALPCRMHARSFRCAMVTLEPPVPCSGCKWARARHRQCRVWHHAAVRKITRWAC